MYCSNCGNSVDEKLKYCNSCGERLSKQESKNSTPGEMLDSILETVLWTSLSAFGILIGLVAVLLRSDVAPQLVVIIAFAYLATVFGICFTLLRQIPKLVDAKLNAPKHEEAYAPPAQLHSKTTAQLEEQRQPIESVTAQTTRSLDEVLVERK
jgi:hypothetical protein